MEKETKLKLLKARYELLNSRPRENNGVIRKLKRQIRNLEKTM